MTEGSGCTQGPAPPSQPASPALLLDKLQQLVGAGYKTYLEDGVSMLDQYAKHGANDADWHFFVHHNWLPVLSVVLGPDWRSSYSSELEAMLALQAMLHPHPSPASPPAQDVIRAASAGQRPPLHVPPPAISVSKAAARTSPPTVPLTPPTHTNGEAEELYEVRAFTVEAVDIDGKRRRLRRKRAASPEDFEDVAVKPGATPAAAAAPTGAPPTLPSPAAAKPAGAVSVPPATRGVAAHQEHTAGVPNALPVQLVMQQVSRLCLSSPPGAMLPPAAIQPHGGTSPIASGSQPPANGSGGGLPHLAAPGAATAKGPSEAAPPGGPQQALVDSLLLIHDLCQRPALPQSSASRAGAPAAAAAPSPSALLSAALADRCDILGRTALHVAAASGRADVAAALLAAGCDVNKRLALDYRVVLRHGLGVPGEEVPDMQAGRGGDQPRSSMSARGKRSRHALGDHVASPAPASLQYCTAMHLAAAAGDVATLEALLTCPRADPNARTIEGATPLHFAARAGHAAAAARLARAAGVDVDAADRRGRTALHVAAAAGHSGVVEVLWARSACIDPADGNGWRPLHYAAREGHTAVAASLVIAGSQVQACDMDGITAAHLAAERGHVDILDKLLMAGYDPDTGVAVAPCYPPGGGTTALHLAAAQGHEGAVAALLRWSASPLGVDALRCSALDAAVAGGHFAVALALLDAGCPLRDVWQTPAAAAPGGVPVPPGASDARGEAPPGGPPQPCAPGGEPVDAARVQQALRCLGAPDMLAEPQFHSFTGRETVYYDIFGAPVSFFACVAARGDARALRTLAKGRTAAAAAPDPWQALLSAVRGGHAAAVRWLVGLGGCTPQGAAPTALLHHATVMSHIEVLAVLLEAGWDPTQVHLGTSPLQEACAHGHTKAASLLIAALQRGGVQGALDAVMEGAEWGLLHHAAANGQTALIEELVAAGAALEAALPGGKTPLHVAAKEGHGEAMQALIRAGADLGAADDRGWTPLHYVAERGDLATFALLHARTAPVLAPASAAALLTAAVRGSCSEMVALVLASGRAGPEACAAAGETPVHVAARAGFVEALCRLRDAGFNMTALDSDGKSALHHVPTGYGHSGRGGPSVHEDFVAAAEVLLECGCKADARDAHGCTPLHVAAGCGSPDMLARFMDLAPGCDRTDEIGWTPLFWAASEGHVFGVDRLLEGGADPFARDCNKRLPLHFAAEAGHAPCVRSLVAAMRRLRPDPPPAEAAEGTCSGCIDAPDQNGHSPVQLAASAHCVDSVAALLDPEGHSADKRQTALHLAAAQRLPDIVRHVLASRRVHPGAKDVDGWTPLHQAAAAGDNDIAGQLLAAQCDADDATADGDTALHKAALGGFKDVVRSLLAGRAQVDVRNAAGSTPLYNAASQGHTEVMQELFESGASVDAATANGCTPLYIAANNGQAHAVAALIGQFGANPDAEAQGGCTPLHAASMNGHTAAVQALLAGLADADAQTSTGASALHNAAQNGHTDVVGALLEGGADADVQNNVGNSPLHVAASKGWKTVVERLVEGGADLGLKNHKGLTPVQSAASAGFFEVVLRLAEAGAAWRHKGEGDVVKMLSRKTTLKASYIEGRLRLMEKVRNRRTSRTTPGGVEPPPVEAAPPEAAKPEVDLEKAAAQADAVMAALLQEENAEKEKAERTKAKKLAKKQKKAAQKQAEASAEAQAAAEAEAEAEAAAEEAAAAALAAVALEESSSDASAEEEHLPKPGKRSPAADARLPSPRAAKLNGKAKSPAPSPSKAKPPVVAKATRNGRTSPEANGASKLGKVPAMPAVSAAKPPPQSVAAAAAQRAGSDGLASAPAMRRPAPVPSAKPAPLPRQQQQQQQQQRPVAIVRPSGPYAAALAGQQPPPPQPAAPPPVPPAATAAAALPPPVSPAARHPSWNGAPPPGAAPDLMLQHQRQAAGLGPPPGAMPQQQHGMQQGFMPASPAYWASAGAGRLPLAYLPPMGPPQQAPVHQPSYGHRPMAPPVMQQPGAPMPRPVQRPPAVQRPASHPQRLQPPPGSSPGDGFVPLFGLTLPPLAGLTASVDWSMASSAPLASSYGTSPVGNRPVGGNFGGRRTNGAGRPTAGPGPSPAPGAPSQPPPGSFSPSDASSIESEASDLLAGLHNHIGRDLAAAVGLPPPPGFPDAYPSPLPKAGIAPSAAPPGADADGIDDVLRMQPWLQE